MAQVNLGRVTGYSAYEIAVENGFVGTEQEWLASLKGDTGATGPQGEVGPAGLDGTNGQDGADGTTFTPSVSAAGIISWTNDGGKENPQSVNIKGPVGPAGTTQWSGIEDKPFSTIGTGLSVSEGVLSATGGGSGGITVYESYAEGQAMVDVDGIRAKVVTALQNNDYSFLSNIAIKIGNNYYYAIGTNDLLGGFSYYCQENNKSQRYFWNGTTLKVVTDRNVVERGKTYTAGDNITISSNNVISATVPADELPAIQSGDAGKVLKVNSGETGVEWGTASADNPLFRITLSTFDAAAFTAAQTAANAGKLVLLDDDTRNFHNLSLLGIYTDHSKEEDEGGNPVPFMAFNKVDAYTYEDNGTVNVYDGMNIQLYASGNVYTSFPYIEYKQQGSSVPVLSTAVLNDNNSNNIFSLSNMENDGFVDGDGNFHYVLFSEESPLTYNSFVTDALYNWEVQADAFSGGGGGTLVAMSGSNWTYVLEGGPDKFWIKDLGNNQYAIDYARNPNWTPPASTVEVVSLVDVSTGNSLYNASNLGITDVGGVWTINRAQLSSTLSSGQQLDVSISGSNVPSVSDSRVTLATISDTPNLTATASPWTITFYLQSNNVYNISLTVGGQN